jgi:hypothetical protein
MENEFTDERRRHEADVFSTRLANLPNELFDLIVGKLKVEELVKLWTIVGTKLFTNNVSKTIMERIYRLRARHCENLTWDDNNPEESLFILWALALLNCEEHEDSKFELFKSMKQFAEPDSCYICPETLLLLAEKTERQTQLTTLKSKDSVKGWKFSENLMWIGDANHSPNEIVSKFLKAKYQWLLYRIELVQRCCYNAPEPYITVYLYRCFRKPDVYDSNFGSKTISNLDSNYQIISDLNVPYSYMWAIKDMVKRGQFQIKENHNRLCSYINSMVLCPRVIMNFNCDDPVQNEYRGVCEPQTIFTSNISLILPIIDSADRLSKKTCYKDLIVLKDATDHIFEILNRFKISDGLFCSLAKYISRPYFNHIKDINIAYNERQRLFSV